MVSGPTVAPVTGMRLAAVLACAALVSPGCSVFSMKSPPATYQASDTPRCNAGKGAVGVDGVMAVALGLGGLAVAPESGEGSLLLFVPAALYGLSAMAGSSSADRCRKAIEAHEAYLASGGPQDDELAQDIAEDYAAVAAESAKGNRGLTAPAHAEAGGGGDGDGGGGGDGGGDGDGDGGGDGGGDGDGDGGVRDASRAAPPDDDDPPRVAPRGDGTWADFWIEVSP